MRRREFLWGVGSSVGALPFAAYAQPSGKIPVVGFFYPGPKAAASSRSKAFLAGLRSGGFSEPERVTLALQIADGDASLLAPMAADLVARQVDLILAISSAAVAAARDATKTIPIVAIDLESDPVGSGFVTNLARPGGNITGVFLDFPDLAKNGSKC
jgi:putative ABC transport system substrate-binding protein